MIDFVFDDAPSPWELALSRLHRGDQLSAARFLSLVRSSEDLSPEDAAMELEQQGIGLDVSDLPKYAGSPETEARLQLEQRLLEQGGWSESLDEKDPLRLFVEELGRCKPIEALDALAAQGAGGDAKAVEQLVDGCLNLVFDCAKEYAGHGVLLMDLVQEGNLGLWQCVLSYDGGDFREKALWWIRQAMARAVTLQAEANGVGDHLAAQMEHYQRADSRLLTQLGRNPTDQELAQELGVTLEESVSLGRMLREARNMAKVKQDRDAPKETPEDSMAVEDTAYFQARQRVSDLMSDLSEQETMVLNLRYGLNGKPPMTAQETAAKLCLTAAQVTALEASALGKMRKESRN